MIMALWKKLAGEKKEYRQMKKRVDQLPRDYRFVYNHIQKYMWKFTAGAVYDMLKIQYELVELFEEGAADDKPVLDVTGEDVASFCDELLRHARTYTEEWHDKLNRDIRKKLGKKG